MQQTPTRIPFDSTRESLALLHEIWKHIRLGSLKERPHISGEDRNAPSQQSPYLFACSFYGIEGRVVEISSPNCPAVPLHTTFINLTSLNKAVGSMLLDGSFNINATREAYIQSLTLLSKFAQQLQLTPVGPLTITWEPDLWLTVALPSVESKVRTAGSHPTYTIYMMATDNDVPRRRPCCVYHGKIASGDSA